jgi:hypothetical protein
MKWTKEIPIKQNCYYWVITDKLAHPEIVYINDYNDGFGEIDCIGKDYSEHISNYIRDNAQWFGPLEVPRKGEVNV